MWGEKRAGKGLDWTRLTDSVTLTETNNMAHTDTQIGNRSWTQRKETHCAATTRGTEDAAPCSDRKKAESYSCGAAFISF